MADRRILFIDAYDSFTNNIVSLLETELHAKVTVIRIDSDICDLGEYLTSFDAVVAGPGPGSPEICEDVGLIAQLWRLPQQQIKPVLGICLGFQSLVYSFGGSVERLSNPRHGVSTEIQTQGQFLFDGLERFQSIQYHSLRGSLGQQKHLWQTSNSCPDLLPLAWDLSSAVDGPILMSVCHKSKPFWGIQFHPESICSSYDAKRVISNWWALCEQYRRQQAPITNVTPSVSNLLAPLTFQDAISSSGSSTPASFLESPRSQSPLSRATSYTTTRESTPIEDHVYRRVPLGKLEIPHIVNYLDLDRDELIVLDSERKLMPNLGRYSIIAVLEPTTTKLTYQVKSGQVKIAAGQQTIIESLDCPSSVFEYLKRFLSQRKITSGPREIPFWGGLIGYITYEACLETIGVKASPTGERNDLSFAFIERSIVIDHVDGDIYVQSIKAQDGKWVDSICSELATLPTYRSYIPASIRAISKRRPAEGRYKHKIASSQEQIHAGNSYELCLTNQATFSTVKSPCEMSWQKYQALRALNPAPFASYMHLDSVTILSTSPERFLHWTRPTLNTQGLYSSTCQFRPIKGTVQKRQVSSTGVAREVGLKEATDILSTAKETAENLMIVDLIRHDLHGVVGSGSVRVPSLMQVEEYSTVYQLVSVIEGDLQTVPGNPGSTSGIDVLAASLPPGSMTGAPKKRACEILRDLEDEPRSVYSGVIGYMCVGGGGDFSVTIRTVFKWDDEDQSEQETWRIGAGGAITILSDVQDEWDEMKGKLRSTERLFS